MVNLSGRKESFEKSFGATLEASFNLGKVERDLSNLLDAELIEKVGLLFLREKNVGDVILLGLREIKARRIFAALGYSSLFEMLVKHYGLSESSSYVRLNAIKLMESFPEAEGAIFGGEVTLTNAALAQSFIHRAEKANGASLSGGEKGKILRAVTGKSTKEAQATLAELNPGASLPLNREKPLSLNHTQVQLTLDAETMGLLSVVRGLLSHSIPDGAYPEILKYMGKLTIEVLQKRKGRAAGVTKKKTTDAEKSCVKNRTFSRATKQAVFSKAKGVCEFVGSDGHRCESSFQVEFDHIIPWSQGGSSDLENCQLLCRSHNQFKNKETHGFWYMASGI